MNDKEQQLIRNIEAAFPRDAAVRLGLDKLCINPNDEEAVEEISIFAGKVWWEISASDWRQHWSAIAFLSDIGIHAFIPSLIVDSICNFDDCNLAVDGLIFELTGRPDLDLRQRLGLLTQVQIDCVDEWFSWIALKHADSFPNVNDAIARLPTVRK